ncbi:MAG: minor capsid protein [Breznakia sp.]
MLTLDTIREWLETLDVKFDNYYIGKLDNKKDKSLGVYQLDSQNTPHLALGGKANTKYKTKAISLLIHWNKNHHDTEIKAVDLYEALEYRTNFTIGSINIYYIEILVNEPIDVHADDKGVYERVIQLILHYERRL